MGGSARVVNLPPMKKPLRLLAAMLFIMSATAHAEARQHKPARDSITVSLLRKQAVELAALRKELDDIRKLLRPQVASADPQAIVPEAPRNPVAVAPMPIPDVNKTFKGYEARIAKNAKLKDLTPKLAAKVAEILASCQGARLTSGYRKGARVAGSGRPSLHSHYPSKAADLAGNPTCIRAHLAKWPGGLSTDYAAVRHYHVSYAPNGREWGARFAHYGSRRHARKTRYAAAR